MPNKCTTPHVNTTKIANKMTIIATINLPILETRPPSEDNRLISTSFILSNLLNISTIEAVIFAKKVKAKLNAYTSIVLPSGKVIFTLIGLCISFSLRMYPILRF